MFSRNSIMSNAEDLLTHRRDVTSGWYFDQARALLDFAIRNLSATALVYAALEARNSLERFVLEMSIAAIDGRLTQEQVRMAQNQDGAFRLLRDAMNNYRQQIEFTNIALDLCGNPFRVAIPDITSFRRLRTDLSDYCHFQLDPIDMVGHPQSAWFSAGVARVQDALDLIFNLKSQLNGVLQRDQMETEVRDVFDAFVGGQIDAQTTRLRLQIMQPVLEQRLRRHRSFSHPQD